MNRIKQLRKGKNMTLVELGEKVNLPKGTLSRYENSSREPKEPTWQALADFFNVSVEYLKGAYSKKEIVKIVQQEYKRQYDSRNEKGFHIIVSELMENTVDDYFISIGVIPYDIKQESYLLTEQQVNDLQFWVNSLEPILDTTVIKWLLEKPTLNATKDDVLEAVNSAMNNIINESSTVFVNPWLARNCDEIGDNQYFAKRLAFINDHTFFDEEVTSDGQVDLVPYIDWNKSHNN